MWLIIFSACLLFSLGNCAPNQCGRVFLPKYGSRIVGGEPTDIYSHPHQVALLYFGSHICGGVLITPRFVITSVSCVADASATQFSIRAGSTYANQGGIVIGVSSISIHPNFNEFNLDYDVAVLYLNSELHQDSTVDFANLVPAGTPIPVGIDATVTGWGTLGENGGLPYQLQEVTVTILSNDDCREAYGAGSITDSMLCAGVTGGGKDACVGDAGGPLKVNNQVVGLVSWGYGCGRPDYPGVYTNLAASRDWITSVTGA